jgi:hypothetical protein
MHKALIGTDVSSLCFVTGHDFSRALLRNHRNAIRQTLPNPLASKKFVAYESS